MGKAEEGGNQPQQVLLVGGPKHGERMNLPAGDTEYKFISDRTLAPIDKRSPWSNFPQTAEHIYKKDEVLSRVLSPSVIFTHEVLWDSPVQGGFNLHALRDAQRAVSVADERLQAKQQIVSDRNREIGDAQATVIELRETLETRDRQLAKLRVFLEMISVNTLQAVAVTGVDYEPQFELPSESPPK